MPDNLPTEKAMQAVREGVQMYLRDRENAAAEKFDRIWKSWPVRLFRWAFSVVAAATIVHVFLKLWGWDK